MFDPDEKGPDLTGSFGKLARQSTSVHVEPAGGSSKEKPQPPEPATNGAVKKAGDTSRDVVKRHNIKYNPRKDLKLRTPADVALNKDVLYVEDPSWQECGGIKITEEAHHKEVAGLSQERIDSLTKHMKPMKHKDAGGMYRSPAEIAAIRRIQAGRMEYELNRLRLVRAKRRAILMQLDADGDGKFNEAEVQTVLQLLYGDTPPPGIELTKRPKDASKKDASKKNAKAVATPSQSSVPDAKLLMEKVATGVDSLTPEQLVQLITTADKQQALEKQLGEHDQDGNGLDEQEVLPLLRKLAPGVLVEPDDVSYLFQICDEDGSGTIDRSEMESLIETWKEMSKKRPKDPSLAGPPAASKPATKGAATKGAKPEEAKAAKSSACVLL